MAHLPSLAAETLAEVVEGDPPPEATRSTVELDAGRVTIALRRRADAG
jgi:hypothetical protein